MIEKKEGRFYVYCDKCHQAINFAYHDFQEAVEGAKRSDWVLRKENKHYVDICLDCQHEEHGMER